MPGQGKARGGSVGRLTAPSSISGPSTSVFRRVCARAVFREGEDLLHVVDFPDKDNLFVL